MWWGERQRHARCVMALCKNMHECLSPSGRITVMENQDTRPPKSTPRYFSLIFTCIAVQCHQHNRVESTRPIAWDESRKHVICQLDHPSQVTNYRKSSTAHSACLHLAGGGFSTPKSTDRPVVTNFHPVGAYTS